MAKFVRHDVGGVLGPAEAGLDEGEAGLHEDDEHRADDDPEQVDLRAEDLHLGRRLGTGRRRDGNRTDDSAGHCAEHRTRPDRKHSDLAER